MIKEIHFIAYEPSQNEYPELLSSWAGTKNAIERHREVIYTTQMAFLSTTHLIWGAKLFVHNSPSDIYEIKMGKNDRTSREIRPAHHLFNLWKSGEFGF